MKVNLPLCLLPGLLCFLFSPCRAVAATDQDVKLWEETITLPTYGVGAPDPNPRFYQGRTYQGARATFYPYPVMDKLTDTREDKNYRAVYLENEYIRISVLPELGGRIFTATDKGNGYDFFYRQHVIKPALIGMLGAWISGGVEWNVPHHHRASSFMAVDYLTRTNADGSKTVWIGETELRHRMRWLIGLTIYPGRSVIEMKMKLFNRTPLPHPVLFWINPAVHANRQYQVLFPPGTEWAVQHAKPEFASWPVAHQVYGGTDYTRGVDISWWKNHPSPVSFFAWNSEEDWFGGYDHGKEAGVLHWADHDLVPGKKFFEWGNGPEGEMWTDVLTDEDGPYLELMAGAWSDNQPDYSWLQPGNMREWKHYWYPVRELGGAKAANVDAALNLEVKDNLVQLAVNTTRAVPKARVRLQAGAQTMLERSVSIGPSAPFRADVELAKGIELEQLRLSVSDSHNRELLAYQPARAKGTPMPKPVERPKAPKEYATADELFYTGQRVEQLYSPSFEAAPYYEEILRRDPGDYRANTALGIVLAKQWRWADAASYLSNAIQRATANHIRPKDGEAFYYLGLASQARGDDTGARPWFAKAAWDRAWESPSYLALAQLECRGGNYGKALEHIERSLTAGARNTKALEIRAAALRKLGRTGEAKKTAREALEIDPLSFGAWSELALAHRQAGDAAEADRTQARKRELMRGEVQAGLELALDYAALGSWREASEMLLPWTRGSQSGVYPMVYYYLAHFAQGAGETDEAGRLFRLAAQMPPDYCFPGRFEDTVILREALRQNPSDALAAYYLGNACYDQQPAEAIRAWEHARELDPSLALVHRNLGLAYAQHEKNASKAVASLERAVGIKPNDARLVYELDVQAEAAGSALEKRLAALSAHEQVVLQRDDATTRWISLLIAAGQTDRAMQVLERRHFHNWEGSGELHDVYVEACLTRGVDRLRADDPGAALANFRAALDYPRNQEVGRPKREGHVGEIYFAIGAAQEALGDKEAAVSAFRRSAESRERGASEGAFARGLALGKLGKKDEAAKVFGDLVKRAQADLSRNTEAVDYFAKFGEKRSERVRLAQAHYLAALGYLGQDESEKSEAELNQALALHPAHIGALRARRYTASQR